MNQEKDTTISYSLRLSPYFVKVLTNFVFSYIMKKIVREKIQRQLKGEFNGETKLQG
jgi:hypothetical protein